LSLASLVANGILDILGYQWALWIPVGFYSLTVLAAVMVGDGIEDALDAGHGS
jgi:ABC-type dipeptide/oligopeptide/nickel transport system permease subunit